VKDPEKALGSLDLQFLAPGGSAPARLDSTTRAWIGHDLFYFADQPARDRFLRDPLATCRALSDPVTENRFQPTARSPQLNYHGRRYYFQSDSTRTVFRGMPDWYAKRGPMDEAVPMAPGTHATH
jgi:YHS domain-containing protein